MISSGDLIADRRYAWAEAAFEEGDVAAAADLAAQALEVAPGFAPAWFLLGKAREAEAASAPEAEPLRAAAIAAFAKARDLDSADTLGAGVRLAQLGVGDPGTAMSPAYVRALFDDYAVRFDRHLTQSLHYRAPDLLHHAVRRACSLRLRPFRFSTGFDLGCGTGLAGERFRAECASLFGVDLSPAMVKRATAKRLYDDLAVGDLMAWLANRQAASADLALSADVFVYMADLAPVFAEVARVLRPEGLFAFTVQAPEGQGIRLGPDGRYGHSGDYLRELATHVGLAVVILEPASTRQDRGTDVPGLLAVLAR